MMDILFLLYHPKFVDPKYVKEMLDGLVIGYKESYPRGNLAIQMLAHHDSEAKPFYMEHVRVGDGIQTGDDRGIKS